MRGRVLTRSFSFETRQHSLLGMDLGEGVPRRALLIGAVMLALWFGLLTLFFGLPDQRTLLFYVSLPLIVIWFGMQPSSKVARRRRMTDWIQRGRFVLYAHEGIKNGAPARLRRDRLKLRERLTFAWLRATFGSRSKDWDPWEAATAASRPFTDYRAVRTGQRLRLYGFDAMTQIRRKENHG